MIDPAIEIGTVLTGARKTITAARLLAFSGGPMTETGWPRKNIHTSTAFARSTGLPDRCASGTQFQGYMVEFLISQFGERWLTEGTMNVKFVDLVFEDQSVTSCARVANRRLDSNGLTRIDLEIWSERNDGRQVMIGTASGFVGSKRIGHDPTH